PPSARLPPLHSSPLTPPPPHPPTPPPPPPPRRHTQRDPAMNRRRMPAHVLQRKPQNPRWHNRVRAAVNRHHLMPRRIKLPQMRNQPRKPPRQRHRLAVPARLHRPTFPPNRRHIALHRP